ncbi:hypothetical protein CAL12_10525 [Bordetella genomosp. 8]|uniref:Arylsulfatase n=1 Tax=Bordetella genomosp. 8 TaxID=1416806 RepID=A0A1W6YJL9_9BORD|nr:hypothetical protein [Bordetella genomosp. 8]ARP81231.1 hypothetical protein CAL12_10525 [Bordetella genomosp. 8]
MRLSFLHTIPANEAIFQQAALLEDWPAQNLRHTVRADLRQAMDLQPAPDGDAHRAVEAILRELSTDADAIVVTCATLGPAVDTMSGFAIPIIRADAALAEAASRAGNNITVLCAVASTIEPNRVLFERYAAGTGSSVTVRLIPEAWPLFQAGDLEACLNTCALAAEDAYRQGADVVAYAHPWMGPAADRVAAGPKPLHAAQAALRAIVSRR